VNLAAASANLEQTPSRILRNISASALAIERRTWQTQPVLIGLFPELDAPGGVQRASRHVAAVLSEFASSHGMDCRLLSLNDSPELHRMSLGGREFVFTGSDRSKARFAMTAVRAARRKAKLVVAGHSNLGSVVQAMKLLAPHMKSIICTHGVDVWEPLSALRRRALRHADLVLAPSRDTAEQVIAQQGVTRNRTRVLPWALDPQFESLISAGSRPSLPENFPRGRVILTVGRWLAAERYKGMDTLITALPRLLMGWPELQLVLVGTGDDRLWLEDFAEKNGVERHVHFLTGLSYSELAGCYSACEVFALPSRGEGFGLVYL
jgi:phosphatidyl-myo-inositol dimannoside synthase